jgi:hypothetical protein
MAVWLSLWSFGIFFTFWYVYVDQEKSGSHALDACYSKKGYVDEKGLPINHPWQLYRYNYFSGQNLFLALFLFNLGPMLGSQFFLRFLPLFGERIGVILKNQCHE